MGFAFLPACMEEENRITSDWEGVTEPLSIQLDQFDPKLTLHALPCGFVKVKRSHKHSSVGIPQILLDPFWTDWLPIWVWLIEHPEGNILIDTGEQVAALQKDHYSCDPAAGWVNRKILKFQVEESWEVHKQLAKIGKAPEDIRWLVLTHMHLDHVDGVRHFQQAEIMVSKVEAQNPYGGMTCLLPSWFSPRRITYQSGILPHFSKGFFLTKAEDVAIISTPGHTYGHQSVLVRGNDYDICLAGDVSFSQEQLLANKVAGINVDGKSSRATYSAFKSYAEERPLIYLPSHDPLSLQRLKNQDFLI
ncbi:MAG: N-acyl homoserine lactonase family protein [Bacteroidota bacterium]